MQTAEQRVDTAIKEIEKQHDIAKMRSDELCHIMAKYAANPYLDADWKARFMLDKSREFADESRTLEILQTTLKYLHWIKTGLHPDDCKFDSEGRLHDPSNGRYLPNVK